MCEIRPDVPTGSTNKYQCWEVVDPEKWVPDGYVVHPRRQPRRRALAGRHRHLVAARGAGPGAMRRMGRRAAVVERQGRAERHLLLRREPVAVRGAAAQAPRRDLPVGGRRRFLPRHGAPRRHLLQRLHQGLVGEPGLYAAARPRHARLQQPHERRLGVGAAGADRRGARRQPPQFLRGLPRAKARHRRLLAVAHAGLVEGQGAAVLGGELGRPGPASARQLRGLRPRRLEAEMAGEPRPRALDAFLHGLRRRRCRRSSSAISSRARRPAGTSSPRCCCRSATSTSSSSGTRRNGRSSAPSGPSCSSIRRISRCRPSGSRRNRRSPTRASATA